MNRLRCGVNFFDLLQDLQLMFSVAVLQNHSLENPFLCKKKLKKGRKKTSPDVTKCINQLPDFFRAELNESGQSQGGMT